MMMKISTYHRLQKKRSKHSLIIHVSDSSEDEVLSNNSKPSTSKEEEVKKDSRFWNNVKQSWRMTQN
jgi:hypothetical protein